GGLPLARGSPAALRRRRRPRRGPAAPLPRLAGLPCARRPSQFLQLQFAFVVDHGLELQAAPIADDLVLVPELLERIVRAARRAFELGELAAPAQRAPCRLFVFVIHVPVAETVSRRHCGSVTPNCSPRDTLPSGAA